VSLQLIHVKLKCQNMRHNP